MVIGVPKEIKKNEYRVSVTPTGAREFVKQGHPVLFEQGAGEGSGFSDDEYTQVGASAAPKSELFFKSDMIVKVKEILPQEYAHLREGLILFTYLHSNAHREMTQALLESKIIGISYEDVENKTEGFPLLKPMSEIAGKGGFLAALQYTQSVHGGSGLLLSRVSGVETPVVTIIGAGIAGLGAAELAAAFGNRVKLLDINLNQLEAAKYKLPPNVELLYSDRHNLEACLRQSDVVINCLLWNKTRKDHLIYKEDLKLMKRGAIIVDVSCDEHGAIETSKATTHDAPTYFEDGILHYAVDNIPSAFARTSTHSLTNATLPFALEIANKGCEKALRENPTLRKGLSFYRGRLTLLETSVKQQLPYVSPETALGISG